MSADVCSRCLKPWNDEHRWFCGGEPAARSPRYPAVSISDRLFNILGIDPIELDDLDHLTYSWEGGYESLTLTRDGGGTLTYSGPYHPGDGRCVGNPCEFCGSARIEGEGMSFDPRPLRKPCTNSGTVLGSDEVT